MFPIYILYEACRRGPRPLRRYSSQIYSVNRRAAQSDHNSIICGHFLQCGDQTGCNGPRQSLITMMTRCCYTRPSGKTERCLTLVTASMFAPARQRWRTTSRLPLFAARWSGVLPDCDAQNREKAAFSKHERLTR